VRGAIVLGVVATILMLLGYFVLDATAAQAERALAEEFSRLSMPPTAALIDRTYVHKPGKAVVGATYRAPVSYTDLRAYYDDELGRNGWIFQTEDRVTVWDKDLGGHQACYRKHEFGATLFYYGDQSAAPRTFGLDLTWGSPFCPPTPK
jgi:hypothetical protein